VMSKQTCNGTIYRCDNKTYYSLTYARKEQSLHPDLVFQSHPQDSGVPKAGASTEQQGRHLIRGSDGPMMSMVRESGMNR
jgi:hypothetical protein